MKDETKLHRKMAAEYTRFLEKLKRMEPADIIAACYEKVFKESVVMYDFDLPYRITEALLHAKDPVDGIYREWLGRDELINMDAENLKTCIMDYAESLIVEGYLKTFRHLPWIGECDMSGAYEVMAVQIEFSHAENAFDETELNITAYDHEELAHLFSDFCTENNFRDVEIKNIFIVRVAINHEELTEIEEKEEKL